MGREWEKAQVSSEVSSLTIRRTLVTHAIVRHAAYKRVHESGNPQDSLLVHSPNHSFLALISRSNTGRAQTILSLAAPYLTPYQITTVPPLFPSRHSSSVPANPDYVLLVKHDLNRTANRLFFPSLLLQYSFFVELAFSLQLV